MDEEQASKKFTSAPCRRAISEAYQLWHRSTTHRARLQKSQEVYRANVSGRFVWYIRNQSEPAPALSMVCACPSHPLPLRRGT